MSMKEQGFATSQIHGSGGKISAKPLATPIYQSSTFTFNSAEEGAALFAGEAAGYIYTRLGNPNQSEVAAKIAALEGAEAGLVFASGMGAVASTLWTVLAAGAHIVADDTLYGCTYALMSHGLSKFQIETSFVDLSKPTALGAALKPETKVVYLESPANPNMKLLDIAALAREAHAYNPEILVIVDNTFCTPYLQKPLALGADVVIHSGTKYLNGHGDVICGAVAAKAELINAIALEGLKDMTGACLSPFDAFLLNRGLKTLDIRMEKHCASAQKVAAYLVSRPEVAQVYYPGLSTHPGHEIACRQMRDFGGILSFELCGGKEAGIKFINSLKLCRIAVSLGDAESLIEHPASMTHSTYSPAALAQAGIGPGLIRFSIGLENVEDIIADLEQGFAAL